MAALLQNDDSGPPSAVIGPNRGGGAAIMPPAIAFFAKIRAATGLGVPGRAAWALVAALHLVAVGILVWSEAGLVPKVAFVLAWGFTNFFWLLVLRRPVLSAALSLVLVVVLVLLSQLKYRALFMTVSFVDLMIIDHNTIDYLFTIFAGLGPTVAVIAMVLLPLLALFWWLDTLRVPRRLALAGFAASVCGLGGLAAWEPLDHVESFYGGNFLSSFARSGVEAISEFSVNGFMESDAFVVERLQSTKETACVPAQKPPHIIVVHDESSFDIRMAPGIKMPESYGGHFRSYDGKQRRFLVEGAGGPSWYTEYNVFSGLSSRSFGRFAYFVTHLAAGRVERGLPNALRRCGYTTFSLYPWLGAFMSARNFQSTAGVQRFRDIGDLGSNNLEPDSFFYDEAARIIERERATGPIFIFTYLAANHFPWTSRYRPDLMPDWRDPGNTPNIDEYLRRQAMSANDYAGFVARLKRDFPDEAFLIVRFGDHQPDFAANIIEPGLDPSKLAQRLIAYDLRYFTTYYAIDAINFTPIDVSSALDALDAPYLPLVVQEAAGLPLDPSFAEQKRILQRCRGMFYACSSGAEARRFNRLLIDAGLIKRL